MDLYSDQPPPILKVTPRLVTLYLFIATTPHSFSLIILTPRRGSVSPAYNTSRKHCISLMTIGYYSYSLLIPLLSFYSSPKNISIVRYWCAYLFLHKYLPWYSDICWWSFEIKSLSSSINFSAPARITFHFLFIMHILHCKDDYDLKIHLGPQFNVQYYANSDPFSTKNCTIIQNSWFSYALNYHFYLPLYFENLFL